MSAVLISAIAEASDLIRKDPKKAAEIYLKTEPSKLLDEARKAAFADAAEKAKIYADAAGAGLGPVVSIVEANNDNGGPRPFALKAMAAPADAAVPVQPGELTFDVNVSVVWSLKTGAD